MAALLLAGLAGGCSAPAQQNAAVRVGDGATAAYASSSDSRAQVAQMADAFAADSSTGSSTYKIGTLDVVTISVFQVPDLSKTVQVSEAGSINYPLIGEVFVAGKSAREVEKILTKALGDKYLRDPQVTVFITEYNSQRVTVQGSVTRPGIYPIQGSLSLLQLMAVAGGLDSTADDTVVVFRTIDGRRSAARYNVSQLQKGATADPALKAGDMVVAGKSAFKEGFNNVLKALPLAAVFTIL